MSDTLQHKGYYADVHFSAQDEVLYGQIIGINDLVNFESDTVKELKKSFKEAVDEYLEACKELNREPDKTYKGSFNVRIPSSLHIQAALIASVKKVSLNDFVRHAIHFTISKEKEFIK